MQTAPLALLIDPSPKFGIASEQPRQAPGRNPQTPSRRRHPPVGRGQAVEEGGKPPGIGRIAQAGLRFQGKPGSRLRTPQMQGDSAPQSSQGQTAVAMLGTGGVAGHTDLGISRQGQAHRRIGDIALLAAATTAAADLDPTMVQKLVVAHPQKSIAIRQRMSSQHRRRRPTSIQPLKSSSKMKVVGSGTAVII